MRTLSQFFVCEENRLYSFFLRFVGLGLSYVFIVTSIEIIVQVKVDNCEGGCNAGVLIYDLLYQ